MKGFGLRAGDWKVTEKRSLPDPCRAKKEKAEKVISFSGQSVFNNISEARFQIAGNEEYRSLVMPDIFLGVVTA